MAIDEAGSTEVGGGLDPEATQFERDITYRAAHAVQTEVTPDAEGAWEEPRHALQIAWDGRLGPRHARQEE